MEMEIFFLLLIRFGVMMHDDAFLVGEEGERIRNLDEQGNENAVVKKIGDGWWWEENC